MPRPNSTSSRQTAPRSRERSSASPSTTGSNLTRLPEPHTPWRCSSALSATPPSHSSTPIARLSSWRTMTARAWRPSSSGRALPPVPTSSSSPATGVKAAPSKSWWPTRAAPDTRDWLEAPRATPAAAEQRCVDKAPSLSSPTATTRTTRTVRGQSSAAAAHHRSPSPIWTLRPTTTSCTCSTDHRVLDGSSRKCRARSLTRGRPPLTQLGRRWL